MIGYPGFSPDGNFFMNMDEARSAIEKLSAFKGRNMQPFTSPVKDFLILPASQSGFEKMIKDMTDNRKPFNTAIMPYRDRLTIVACAEDMFAKDAPNHCSIEQFIELNGIDPAAVFDAHALGNVA